MKNIITKEIVADMYNPKLDGVIHFQNYINDIELNNILEEISKNKDIFEIKREKYIDNNQEVALIYRGKFGLEELNNTIFTKLFNKYIDLRQSIKELSDIPFDTGNILEVKIIKYPISDLGVAAHKDLSSNVNMVTFFNLSGEVDFYTYKDKKGNFIKKYRMKAGDISFMRAPRHQEINDIRPIHGVEKVNIERMVLAIREIRTDLEEETNKGNWRGF